MAQKRRRLSRSAEFERVYRQGRSKGNRYLVLYAFPRAEDEATAEREAGPRLGLSVSRRVGGAVDRNRVKRVLREAFWAEAERLPDTSDYVVVARPDARELAEREGADGMRGALSELVAPSCSPRSVSTSATSRRCSRVAASTSRRARSTRWTRCASTARCAASCSPAGGSCAVTRGVTGATTRSRSRRCSSAASLQQPVRTDPDGGREVVVDEADERAAARGRGG